MKIIPITRYGAEYSKYFCQVEQISREYLAEQASTSEDEGVVEVPFDEPLLRRLLGHKGAYLLLAIDTESDDVMGFSEFHTCADDFPEETEDLAEVMKDYKPFAWCFYIVKARRYRKARNVTSSLCKATFAQIAADGCKYAVADYMLTPEFCNAGRRLLKNLGFVYAHKHYGMGLVPAEKRSCENKDRTDTYEIMLKDLRTESVACGARAAMSDGR